MNFTDNYIAYVPNEFVYYVSLLYNSSLNDKNVNMEENKIYLELHCNKWIAVDLEYCGLQHEFKYTAFPYLDNEAKVERTEEQKLFNSEFKTVHTVVENVIMYIKKWKICKYTFRAFSIDLDKTQDDHHKI